VIELTVKRLREQIKDLPDDTPVMYQRIEDVYFQEHNWKTVALPWEPWQEGAETSDFIGAFSAYVTEGADGKPVLCIHAHY
jgi:hypothetical protein